MAFVERRVFYGKVGQAGALAEHLAGLGKIVEQHGGAMDLRFLTDHNSGRTDRVVMEWTVDALSDFEALNHVLAASDAARKAFGQWEKQMNDMVHYAETEVWQLH